MKKIKPPLTDIHKKKQNKMKKKKTKLSKDVIQLERISTQEEGIGYQMQQWSKNLLYTWEI